VPPRDPEALSEAVLRLLGDTELRQSMAVEGQMLMAEEFRREAMVERTAGVYRKLLTADRGAE
jgi:glycosyltransferase involved in cell wall biosynthesis